MKIPIRRNSQRILDGLILALDFNESNQGKTLKDKSGKGYDATINNLANTPRTAGRLNQALYFDGSVNSYASIPTNTVLDGNATFTVVFTFRHYAFNYIISKNKRDYLDGWAIAVYPIAPLRLYAKIYGTGGPGTDHIFQTLLISSNEWHFGAIARSGTSDYIIGFLDGKWETQADAEADALTNTEPLYIGAGGTLGAGDHFNGWIDSILMFNRALSTSDLTDLYRNWAFMGELGRVNVKHSRLPIRRPATPLLYA